MRIIFIFFLLFSTTVWGQVCNPGDKGTVLNANGDLNCVSASNPNVSYEVDSQATLDARDAAQAPIIAQQQADKQQEQLIQDDIRSLAIQDLQNQGLIDSTTATVQESKLTTLQTAQATAVSTQTVSGGAQPAKVGN